jgi:hypothetical protein
MIKRKNSFGVFISIIYISLCSLSLIYHINRHQFDKFSSIFISILTAPWSLSFALFKDLIIASIFHYEFSFLGNTIVFLISILINTLIIIIFFRFRKFK